MFIPGFPLDSYFDLSFSYEQELRGVSDWGVIDITQPFHCAFIGENVLEDACLG